MQTKKFSALLSTIAIMASLSYLASGAQVKDRLIISPSLTHVKPGASQQFRVEVEGQPARVSEWSVNDVRGGNAEFGHISASGVYTAPAVAPTPHEIHIRATVKGRSRPYVWATVLMSQGEPVYKLVGSWGEKGKGPGKFIDPHSIWPDRDGNLIIVDAIGSHVWRYTKEGKYLGELGKGPGSGPGQFNVPRDVKLDKAGNIYISDGNNHRIQVFSPEGKYLRMFGHKGTAPGEMLRVHSLWFGLHDQLYADDVDNSRIMVYNTSGKFLFEWGKAGKGVRRQIQEGSRKRYIFDWNLADAVPGEFHAPHGLGGDANGDIFVSNYWGPCQKFTADGKFLLSFAPPSTTTGEPTHWHSMASDRWGNVYLMSRTKDERHSIRKYNNNGTFITSFPPLRPLKEWGVKAAYVAPDGTVYATIESKEHVGVEIYREQ